MLIWDIIKLVVWWDIFTNKIIIKKIIYTVIKKFRFLVRVDTFINYLYICIYLYSLLYVVVITFIARYNKTVEKNKYLYKKSYVFFKSIKTLTSSKIIFTPKTSTISSIFVFVTGLFKWLNIHFSYFPFHISIGGESPIQKLLYIVLKPISKLVIQLLICWQWNHWDSYWDIDYRPRHYKDPSPMPSRLTLAIHLKVTHVI